MTDVVESLAGALIVSCQPVVGGPMDAPVFVVGFALAALAGGAKGLRIEGVENVRAVRAATDAPIIGLVKRVDPETPVIITATPGDVEDLAAAGADIIAFDATDRAPRPARVAALADRVRALGKRSMADLATADEARAAASAGCDVIGTTLAGYTGGPVPDDPDIDLVAVVARLGRPVFAEGRYRTPEQVAAARRAGATAVVVGSAVTRPEHITSWFAQAVRLPGEVRP